jgi:hypothetical protein
MGCAEQLIRVGALAFTHARPEVVWAVKRAAPKPRLAGAMRQISIPFCLGHSDRHHALQPFQLMSACPHILVNTNLGDTGVTNRRSYRVGSRLSGGTSYTAIAQPVSDSETTEVAQSDGVHSRFG